ncbi:MAG: DNA repair protein RecN, partial [Actinobacteria bacterium]|nr:DNA repair protein RecN [Actinomycetota bacterium]
QHLGIVDEITLALGPGMTVITGETGAGKTLLVEALELLVGGRADSGLVRAGDDAARVEGRFDGVDLGALDPDSVDDEVVLGRVVPASGRSRAYVNGRLATAGELAGLGARLVDLHGQHEHQSLLEPASQRRALDAFAGDAATEALAQYRAARDHGRRVDDALAALGGDSRGRARELDLLRFQAEELERAQLSDAHEDAALEAEEELLADAAAHGEALDAALAAVQGPALDALGDAYASLANRRPFDALAQRLRSLQADVSDVGHELRVAAENVVVDPARLAEIGERRRTLRELTRKYGETLADVMAFARETGARIDDLTRFDERVAELEAQRERANVELTAAAERLSAVRRTAAPRFAAEVTSRLQALAMPSARLEIELRPAALTEDGADDVVLLLAANPGEPARPLARAASGGELARAMLAVRVVLAGARSPGDEMTLVFDEVDAGIGGEAGVAVGRALSLLAARQQVLCVTHLAQVAAFADSQVVVAKRTAARRTIATAELLDPPSRIAELSRMLAGATDSVHARGHAEELIVEARRVREASRAGRRS